MNEQELIERIILEIEIQGIEVIGDNSFPLDAVTNNRLKITIFNPLTIKAFKLCHELMHIKNNDSYRLGECDTTSPQEKKANAGAFWFLWDIFKEQGGRRNDLSLFCEISGCSLEFAEFQIGKHDAELIEELNYQNLSKNHGTRSLEDCLDEFMADQDYEEPVSIENFLEKFGFPRSLYDRAEVLIREKMECPVIFPFRFF